MSGHEKRYRSEEIAPEPTYDNDTCRSNEILFRDGEGESHLDSGIFSECPSSASPIPSSPSTLPIFSLRDKTGIRRKLSTSSSTSPFSLRSISTSSTSVLDRLDSLSSKLSGLGIPAPHSPRSEEREDKAALMAKLATFLAKHSSNQPMAVSKSPDSPENL